MNTEIQALQNAVNYSKIEGLAVHEKHFDDKRRTTKKYFLSLDGCSISPVLDYECLNHFLHGISKGKQIFEKSIL